MSLLPASLRSSFASASSPSTTLLQTRGIKFAPKSHRTRSTQKGVIPIRTGGSTRGTTLQYGGEYGIRTKQGIELSAKQLEAAYDVLRRKTKSYKGTKIFMNIFPNRPICVKGNETRMGKGKGTFEYWACNVPMNGIVFEIKGGNIREPIAREIFRVAIAKLPCGFSFITPQSKPRVGYKEVDPEEETLAPLSAEELAREEALKNVEDNVQIRHLGPVKSSARRQGLLEGVDMATGQSWEEVWAEAAKRGEVSVAPEATIRAGL